MNQNLKVKYQFQFLLGMRRGTHFKDRKDKYCKECMSSGDIKTSRLNRNPITEQFSRVSLYDLVCEAKFARYLKRVQEPIRKSN